VPIPTEPIGSIPRPPELIAAMAAGAPPDELDALQDEAVRDTIARFEETGSPVITDGEQRKPSFATYPVAGLAGLALPPRERAPRQERHLDGPGAALPSAARKLTVEARGRLHVDIERVEVKLRYRSPAVAATVEPTPRGFRLRLNEPAYGVAPGQAAVLYDGDLVIGQGTITRAE